MGTRSGGTGQILSVVPSTDSPKIKLNRVLIPKCIIATVGHEYNTVSLYTEKEKLKLRIDISFMNKLIFITRLKH